MRYPETAALIKSARRRKGWSQERAAAELGCSRLQVIRWEQGLHKPDPESLGVKVVEVLGVKERDLASADADEEDSLHPLARDLHAVIRAIVRNEVRA